MERINRIWNHPEYQKHLKTITGYEADRVFCKHDMSHILDVARIMWILNEKEQLHISEELIYATALLHDIGRALQYSEKIEHEVAGGKIAPAILKDAGFIEAQIQQIVGAIANHRKEVRETSLGSLLYRADKLSRDCFCCKVRNECYWPDEKKNLEIKL